MTFWLARRNDQAATVREVVHPYKLPAAVDLTQHLHEEEITPSREYQRSERSQSLWTLPSQNSKKMLHCSGLVYNFVDGYCITASGSRNHQLLAAMKKRRKSPNLPQDEGAPPLLWVLSTTNKHPSTFQTSPPSYLPATSADPPSTPIPRSRGDHTPLHPF